MDSQERKAIETLLDVYIPHGFTDKQEEAMRSLQLMIAEADWQEFNWEEWADQDNKRHGYKYFPVGTLLKDRHGRVVVVGFANEEGKLHDTDEFARWFDIQEVAINPIGKVWERVSKALNTAQQSIDNFEQILDSFESFLKERGLLDE